MKKLDKYNYCKVTKKYSFSSEARAIRKLNSYEDIKRVYFCKHCEGFHLTSKEWDPAMDEEDEPTTIEEINKRLEFLKNKLDEE